MSGVVLPDLRIAPCLRADTAPLRARSVLVPCSLGEITSMLMPGVLLTATAILMHPAKIEHLGQPCRAKNVLAGRVVADRRSGREWFVITNMNETTGAELIFIDFQRDKG